jgi:hypothetical protein
MPDKSSHHIGAHSAEADHSELHEWLLFSMLRRASLLGASVAWRVEIGV